ncbi:hypothetical protein GIY62_07060 [Burkholderia plantarii]|uniref:hypothetical protein n=1 Tax=Burkholderia plantarii TaxID=41899 RepID=UPI00272C5D49|nr:hypothetical protein [Burkholderia plantarii]WLE60403.1 hypothetical protein GIY62_07060 [Burkholderia plantarii]
MGNEKFEQVNSDVFCNGPYEFLSLIDTDGVLKVAMEDASNNIISVEFDGYIFFSKIDEGDAFETINTMYVNSCIGATLIRARNSNLLKWFDRENHGVRGGANLVHYILLMQNDIINVISLDVPSLIFKKNS